MNFRHLAAIASGAFLSATSAHAAERLNLTHEGVAVLGYDPVAYFVSDQAVKGSSKITAEFAGATYHFSSGENLAIFLANPVRYLPQYGGFCAYGVALGATPQIDPKVHQMIDGKLYLGSTASVMSQWRKDAPRVIKAADKSWKILAAR